MTAYVFIDVSRKQEYIFRQNQLRLNLYHSMVIKLLTEDVPDFPHMEYSGMTLRKFLKEKFTWQYEFVYSGGGNSIIRWHDKDTAEKFITLYTTQVLKEYPELELYISMVRDLDIPVKADENRDILIWNTLIERSDRLKDKRRARFKRWSYGIEEIGETGLPEYDEDREDSDYLQDRIRLVKKYLASEFESDNYLLRYTDELQDYRQDNEGDSYIGVIAVDGNRMGELFSRITSFKDRSKFSRTIEELYRKAMVSGLYKTAVQLGLKKPMLFTPIIMAGDDACLIVPAQTAVQSAANIVQTITELSREPEFQDVLFQNMDHAIADPSHQLHACVGVAIAKFNYPFFELVRRAEAKCRDAKEKIYQLPHTAEVTANASFLDWGIVQGQTESTEEPERNRFGDKLRIRPLRLGGNLPAEEGGIYSYQAFLDLAIRLRTAVESEKANERISKSFLTELKRAFHAGWEVYQSLFDMKQTDDGTIICNLVREMYPASERATILETCPDNRGTRTFLLNDVLQMLRFIQPVQGDSVDAGTR